MMNKFLKWLFGWLFAAAIAEEADKRNKERSKRQRPAPLASALAVKAGEELIREALPRIVQRTTENLVPLGPDGKAMSMDGAEARHSLPDIYGVQDTVPGVVFSWFGAHSFIGHQACAFLAQHWLVDKACSQAPKDAVQNGFEPVISMASGEVPPEVAQEIRDHNDEIDIVGECREFSRNSRIFGIRHALFLVDGIDYSAPFNPDGVTPGSYKGISQIDPYWLTPEFDSTSITNPSAKHFYEPTWWRLPDGKRVHRSHFIILRESEVPDVLKPTYYYGGLPIPQLIYERVYAAERTANEAPELAMSKRLLVSHEEVDFLMGDEEEGENRLYQAEQLRNNFGIWAVGDADIEQFDTSLADFDTVLMSQYQLVAAIARTPATKMLGTSPKGFNATGEHESDSYDQELVTIQSGMTPLLNRHHLLLCRSRYPQYPDLIIRSNWNPVRKLKPGENADINLKKAQTSQAHISAGVTAPEEERDRLIADPDGGYSTLVAVDDTDDFDLGNEGDSDV